MQSLPCDIDHDGHADVSARLVVRDAGGGALESAFRGRALRGRDVALPAGVTGLVLDTTGGDARIRQTFENVRVWSRDAAPGADHPVLEALDTVEVLRALHDDSFDAGSDAS